MEDNVLEIEEIKTPQDILTYMNENIEYGWMNINNSKHIKTMKEFRKIIKQLPNLNIGSCFILERVARIELALSGRKHDILPLNYTRKYKTII